MSDFSQEAKLGVVKEWNGYYSKDPTNISQLNRKYFQNSYLTPLNKISNSGSFSLAGYRRMPYTANDNDSNFAWILAAGPGKPENLHTLLDEQFKILREKGYKVVNYSNFSPGYFYPGVDREAYGELYDILIDAGFKKQSEGIAMSADLEGISQLPIIKDNVEIKTLDAANRGLFETFIKKYYPGDCATRVEGVIKHGSLEQITIAKVQEKIVGYAMYSVGEGPMEFAPGERFGCFEVLDTHQSMGIGGALLSTTLISMKSNGIKKAYFLWTGERAKKLYERFGFKETRRFQILERDIE